MPEMTNCKNCGAPLTGCECEYCGTRYESPERIILYADDEPVMVIVDEPALIRKPPSLGGVITH